MIESTSDLLEFIRLGLPEKRSDLDSLISETGVTFYLDDKTERTVFKADSQAKKIMVGQKGMERLWAHAYAYSGAFRVIPPKIANNSLGGVDPSLELMLDDCSKLLRSEER